METQELIRQDISAQPGNRRQRYLSLPIEYSLPEWSYHCFSHTIDISELGLSMHVPQEFDKGQNLRLTIYDSSQIYCTEVLGEIIRVDSFEKPGKGYRCSVAFVDRSSEIVEKLRKFLQSFY